MKNEIHKISAKQFCFLFANNVFVDTCNLLNAFSTRKQGFGILSGILCVNKILKNLVCFEMAVKKPFILLLSKPTHRTHPPLFPHSHSKLTLHHIPAASTHTLTRKPKFIINGSSSTTRALSSTHSIVFTLAQKPDYEFTCFGQDLWDCVAAVFPRKTRGKVNARRGKIKLLFYHRLMGGERWSTSFRLFMSVLFFFLNMLHLVVLAQHKKTCGFCRFS